MMPTASDAHRYDQYYYEHGCGAPYKRTPEWLQFYARIADAIVRHIGPRTVLDAGCALGFIVEALRDRGVAAFGIDISEYAIQNVREDMRPYVRVASILDPLPERYDLVVCSEVLEHLTAAEGEQAIANLCKASDDILFSSTPEDYREVTHFNVRPPDYWATLFALNGFVRDVDFDASFLTPWAVRFRRNHELMHRVLGAYDRKLWLLWKENVDLRHENVEMRRQHAEMRQKVDAYADLLAQVQWLQRQVQSLSARLDAITHSNGWALLQGIRRTRLLVAPRCSRRERILQLGIRALRLWKGAGFAVLLQRAARKFTPAPVHNRWHQLMLSVNKRRSHPLDAEHQRYQDWLNDNRVTERVRGLIRADIGYFEFKPTFSVVMPVHNPPLRFLREAIESVRRQLYEGWELCIADDGSDSDMAEELHRWVRVDPRIKLTRSEVNEGIAEATNRALGLATGEFVGLLDHDDVLDETALYYVVKALNEDQTLDVLYTDKDHVTDHGVRTDPYFKPDWSPHAILSHNYIVHFLVFRRSLLEQVGRLRKEYDGAQDYDLILRLTERTNRIRHIPKVLYSWRRHPGSNSQAPKPAAFEAARLAIQDAVSRRGDVATTEKMSQYGPYKVNYSLNGNPLVSIVISSCKIDLLRACFESLKSKTTYRNYEVLVATNAVGNQELRAYCTQNNIELVEIIDGFFSKMNNRAAEIARGRYIVFLNDDTLIVTPQWIEEMLSLCQRPDVVAVGPKLVLPSGEIQFTHMVLGIRRDGVPYFFDTFASNDAQPGPFFGFSPDVVSDVTAVCGACMMVKRSDFLADGGFNVDEFNICWQDMDWCVRQRMRGASILYTPHAVVVHYGSFTKKDIPQIFGKDVEQANAFFKKHRRWLSRGDEFHNPNLADVHAFIEPLPFPGLDRIEVSEKDYGYSYWMAYGFPMWPKGHFISNRSAFVEGVMPFATSVLQATKSRTVVDAGCGLGVLLEAFQRAGAEAWGLEPSRDAMKHVPGTVRNCIVEGDLIVPADIARLRERGPFGVTVCIEVLEHIPADLVPIAIRNAGTLSDTVVVSTPKPNLWDCDDKTHLCVMPRDFWVRRFRVEGFVEDEGLSRRIFGQGYQHDPDAHMFVFVRSK